MLNRWSFFVVLCVAFLLSLPGCRGSYPIGQPASSGEQVSFLEPGAAHAVAESARVRTALDDGGASDALLEGLSRDQAAPYFGAAGGEGGWDDALSAQDMVPEVLGAGDVVQVDVWDEAGLSVRAEISQEGTVVLPLTGTLQAGGRTRLDLENAIKAAYADGYLVDPQLSVTVVVRRSSNVYVLGAARKPGSYPLVGRTTLLELLAQCGGAAENASEDILIIRRGGEGPGEAGSETEQAATGGPELGAAERSFGLRVNHSQLLMGDLSGNVVLRDRDTVLFPPSRQSREQVYMLGDVDRRGTYALEEGMTLAHLLASAGLNPQNEKCTVTVARFGSGGMQSWAFNGQNVLLGKEGSDFTLNDGDILTVSQVMDVYYVIGQVRSGGTFRFQPGLTVREAVIIAGWVTSRGNMKNIEVMRRKGSEWEVRPAELTDEVRPDDIIDVKERWF